MTYKDIKEKTRYPTRFWIHNEGTRLYDEDEVYNSTEFDDYEIEYIIASPEFYGESLGASLIIGLKAKDTTKWQYARFGKL